MPSPLSRRIEGWDDCGLFAPEPFATWDDPAIAINILAEPNLGWNDPFAPLTQTLDYATLLVDEETSIGGRRAWTREFEFTQDLPGENVFAGDRQLTYAVELPDGWFLHADLISRPETFDAERAVFETMLESLEALEVPEQ
jgi:hypothetical protein